MEVKSTLDNHGKRLRYLEGLEEVLGIYEYSWAIAGPAIDTIGQVYILFDCNVVGVYANVMGDGICEFNIQERDTLNVDGVNILSSDMAADASGKSVTAGFNNSSLAAGNHLTIDISGLELGPEGIRFLNIALMVT